MRNADATVDVVRAKEMMLKLARALSVPLLTGVLVVFSATAASAVGSVTMTTSPSSSVSGWSLVSSGSNSTSGGTMTLSATAPYTVTVAGDKARLSEWDGSSYVSGGKTLGTALTVTTARTGGTNTVPGIGAAVPVSTSAGTLVTGTGTAVTGGTDTFSVTLSQTTGITDAALVSGHTYHIVLTYTAQLTL